MAFQLPALPYAFNAPEPHIDAQTMETHYTKHHQAYIDNLNKAITGSPAEKLRIEEILQTISKYSPAVRNNSGAIDERWSSLDEFKKALTAEALGRFGSGWAWLLVKFNGQLEIGSTPNQDNPLMDTNMINKGIPILGLDVWEHAYYLKYQNRRAEYVNAFWNVLDWKAVENRYVSAVKK